jgi:hypothetical protein
VNTKMSLWGEIVCPIVKIPTAPEAKQEKNDKRKDTLEGGFSCQIKLRATLRQ